MKTWIYHETEQPKIIDQKEYNSYKEDGWLDSPAPFLSYEDIGLDSDKIKDKDEDELAKASLSFDAVEGLVDLSNGQLNLEEMSKNELETYARKHLDTELDKRRSKKRLIAEIRELLDGDS